LHVTAPPQNVDLASYRLEVKGKVARELSLTFDEIRCLPKVSAAVEIQCPGFFVDRSNLAGASLAAVLALAGPDVGAASALFVGVDSRAETVDLAGAQASDAFLAYEWEGEWLPISHGFPIRVALPGRLGGSWVKWLKEISVV
jgi:DMSO/TMAO reductase YedYZ molybdopterin-dependent catalytic subunit